MSLLAKTVKPKAILANKNKLKKIMANGQQIWSGAVAITFVEAGVRVTVEYEEGATVSRSTAPSGATFVGWSMSSSGSNPQKTFIATADMTVYRVISKAVKGQQTLLSFSGTTIDRDFSFSSGDVVYCTGNSGSVDFYFETGKAEDHSDSYQVLTVKSGKTVSRTIPRSGNWNVRIRSIYSGGSGYAWKYATVTQTMVG